MKILVTICALVCMAATAAQAIFVNVVESRLTGGAQNPLYTQNGPAITSAKSTATALANWTGGTLTGTGSYYAGQTTPSKWGEWSFTPATGGYYDVYATWAANAYAAGVPAPLWTVNNAGAPVTINLAQTSGGNAWNNLATGVQLNAATAYKTSLATVPDGVSGKRTYFDSVAWASSTPGAATLTGPANGATDVALDADLTWSAGSFTSFFDVFFSVDPDPAVFATDLAGGTSSLDLGTLAENTTYYWKVKAKNVDQSADSEIYSFTTLPEPAAMALLVLGSMGSVVLRRRRA